MASKAPITLPSLLPSSYLIAYAVPILVVSLISTFAGAFLTLDRTRSFAPIEKQNDASQKRLSWRYGGGIGGTAGGFLCGVHLSAFLALLISNRTSSSLGPVQFLIIWMLSGVSCAVLSSRWRIAASCAYGIIGGGSIATLISIIFLPSLTARLVILAIFTILLLVGILLPHPIVRHSALRTSSAFSGALGIVEAIALFRNVGSWSSPWLALVIKPVVGTRNSAEKGLSAAVCIFAVAGIISDWLLKRYIGENPDKEWDAYLSKYAKGLPFDSERQGFYRPFPSIWEKLFGRKSKASQQDEIAFPSDSALLSEKAIPLPSGFKPNPTRMDSTRTMLNNPRKMPQLSDSDSDSDDDATGPPKFRPWLGKRNSSSNSAATTIAVRGGNEKKRFSFNPEHKPVFLGSVDPMPSYSDEEDVTASHTRVFNSEDRKAPGWRPKFIRDHEEEKERMSIKSKILEDAIRSDSPDQMSSSSGTLPSQTEAPLPSPQQPVAVPATPSLIRAVDRINQAQRDAYGFPPSPPPRMLSNRGQSFDTSFWNEVHTKAMEGESEKRGKTSKA